MLDLKHLLIEARQKIPPFLASLESENEKYLDIGGRSLRHLHFLVLLLFKDSFKADLSDMFTTQGYTDLAIPVKMLSHSGAIEHVLQVTLQTLLTPVSLEFIF